MITSSVVYSDGSSQLREMTRDKNNTAQIEGVMMALQTNGADQENLNHVFLSFSDPREEYISYCRDLLHTLFLSEVVCCVCFDAQELLISLIGYLSIPCHSVYAGWSVMDLKVSQLKYIKLFFISQQRLRLWVEFWEAIYLHFW